MSLRQSTAPFKTSDAIADSYQPPTTNYQLPTAKETGYGLLGVGS